MHLLQAQGGAEVGRGPRRTRLWAALVAVGVVVLDQLTKSAVVGALDEGESVRVLGDVLRISHVRNTGAAFGLLRGFGGAIALAATVGVIIFAAVVVRRPPLPTALGAALVAAGASGNLIDRIFRGGGVVDFVDFRFWPSFNVADSAITVGAILLLSTGFFDRRPKEDADARTGG